MFSESMLESGVKLAGSTMHTLINDHGAFVEGDHVEFLVHGSELGRMGRLRRRLHEWSIETTRGVIPVDKYYPYAVSLTGNQPEIDIAVKDSIRRLTCGDRVYSGTPPEPGPE